MSLTSKPEDKFGCKRCWPVSAKAAWAARGTLAREARLIDESHLIVTVLCCSACGQRFLSVFAEEVDWVDGDDPQYWALMPLTRQEAADLVHNGGSLGEEEAASLGPERRSLRRDYPKGVDKASVYWSSGISIRLHD